MSETTTAPAPVELEVGYAGQEHPAERGRPARPGPGRLRGRHQAARDGLCPLRPRAVRSREDRLGRRLGRGGAGGRLRDADAGRGRGADRSVLRADDRAGEPDQGLRARGRARPPHRRAGRRSRGRDQRAREGRRRPGRGRVRAARRRRRRAPRTGRGRRGPPRRRRHERRLVGGVRLGRRRRGAEGRRPRREDQGAPLRPLLLDAARVLGGAGRARPGHRPVHDPLQPPDAGRRRDLDGAGAARPARQAPLRHPGHRRRVREQDHDARAADRLLPARPEAEAADPVDGVAHRPAHGERARERALVPRDRGRRPERRDDARVQGEGARRLRRVPALRAARLHHLGAGHARPVPLAEHPRRLHPGRDEQVARGAEPRLLADAAALADRADLRHRRPRARPRSGRGPEEELREGRRDAVRDARTAASTTRATTRAAWTSRSS